MPFHLHRYQLTLERGSLVFLGLAITGFFYFPDSKAHSFATYLLALLLLANPSRWWGCRDLLRESRVFRVSTALILFFASSALWSDQASFAEVFRSFGVALLIITFMLSVALAVKSFPTYLPGLLILTILCGCLAGGIAVYGEMERNGIGYVVGRWRFSPEFARLDNPVVGGATFGFAFASAVALCLILESPRLRWVLASAAFLLSLLVLLTGSRAAILACILTLGVAFLARYRRHWLAPSNAAVLLGGAMIVMLSIAFTAFSTHPVKTPADALARMQINEYSELDEHEETGLPKGVLLTRRIADPSLLTMPQPGVASLAPHLDSVGIVWPAFRVEPGFKYFVDVRLSVAQAFAETAYIVEISESDVPVMEGRYISRNPKESRQPFAPVSRRAYLAGASADSDAWQRHVIRYLPTESAKWASPIVINRSGSYLYRRLGEEGVDLLIDFVRVYKLPLTGLENLWGASVNRDSPFRKILVRESEGRNLIWADIVPQVLGDKALFGYGAATSLPLVPRDGKAYDHMHNLFLSCLYYGGVVGFLLSGYLLLCALLALKQVAAMPLGALSGILLSFAFTCFIFDGGNLLEKINYLWLLFWFPLAVLAGLELSNPRAEET